jgi:hypothetical protein
MERSPILMDWQNQHSKSGYITRSNLHVQCNSHQNPHVIHHNNWEIYPKIHLEIQKTAKSQDNTEQKYNAGGITILHFKLNYRTIAIKAACYWHKNRYEGQCNGQKDADMNLAHLFFDKDDKNNVMKKRQSLQQMLLRKLDICLQKTETRSMFVTLYKYQLKVG